MTVRLWIEETANAHDELSKDLVEVLGNVLQTQGEIRALLETVKEINTAYVIWPASEFSANRFWMRYVLDLRRPPAQLRPVVGAAADRFPLAGLDKFLVAPAVRPSGWYHAPEPLKAQFVGPGAIQPMFDRTRLREELKALVPAGGFRTLNITGGTSSGKTFSMQLLQMLAATEDFRLLTVDIADWGGEPFTAVSLVETLAIHLQVRIDTSSAAAPDPHTRARLLAYAVCAAFPVADGETRWIVIDGLDRFNVDPDALALVERLFKSIDVDGRPSNVRLVVTGFDGILPSTTRKDPIGKITDEHVKELLQETMAHLELVVATEQLDEWTATVWGSFDESRHTLADLGRSAYEIIHPAAVALAAEVGGKP